MSKNKMHVTEVVNKGSDWLKSTKSGQGAEIMKWGGRYNTGLIIDRNN
jgi:hypothetical protein